MNPLLTMLFSMMFPNMGGMNSNPLLNMLMGNNSNMNGNNQMMNGMSGNPLMDMLMGGLNPNMNNGNQNMNGMSGMNQGMNQGMNNPNQNNYQENPMDSLNQLASMLMGNQNNPYTTTTPNTSQRHKHSKRKKR